MTAKRFLTTRTIVPAAVVVLVVAAIALFGHNGTMGAQTQSQSLTAADPRGLITGQPDSPKLVNPATYVFPVKLTDAQWRARLTHDQYETLRQQGTDPPFQNAYWNNEQSGTYYSAATGQPLFSSKDKFDSGTGWPSFTKPIDPKNVVLAVDSSLGMQRIEAEDSLSGSHLGHVFDDGPPPTGLRYCMDSTALIFVPDGGTPPPLITTQLAQAK
jgi:peptide-methionine (R)-S-oxide reductase